MYKENKKSVIYLHKLHFTNSFIISFHFGFNQKDDKNILFEDFAVFGRGYRAVFLKGARKVGVVIYPHGLADTVYR